jgi:perosamine synthetase
MIPHSRPDLRRGDFAYVAEILRTRQLAGGQFVGELESRLAQHVGKSHGIATSSATAALHVTLVALGAGPNREVILPSYTCAEVLNAVHQTGARAVLVDIDPNTLNPDPPAVRRAITSSTVAVIVTHTFGYPAATEEIAKLGPPVIEDCAQAVGASRKGQAVGVIGNAAVFSFYATKPLGAGEGGAVCTADEVLAATIRDLVTPDMREEYHLRYTCRMSDLTAGLALRQLERLPAQILRRRQLAARYERALASSPVLLPQPIVDALPSHYRFIVRTDHAEPLIQEAQARGIMCERPVFKPLHEYLGLRGDPRFRGTDEAWRTIVSVPLYPALRRPEATKILHTIPSLLRTIGH